jgi:hypothetical protein
MVEEADLLQLLAERGAEDPAAARKLMTVLDVVLAMDAEAMMLVHLTSARAEPAQKQAHVEKYNAHQLARDGILDKYVTKAEEEQAPAF